MRKKHRYSLAIGIATVFVTLVVAFFSLPRFLGDMTYPLKYADTIRTEAKNNSVPPELVAALILAESSFNEKSVSGAGAMGITQMMPGTARGVAKRNGLPTSFNLLDANTSIKLGTLHIKELLDQYSSLSPENQEKAMLIAYNAGSGVADAWIRGGMQDKYLSYGVRYYVKKIQRYEEIYRQMYASELGIEKVQFQVASEPKKTSTTTFWMDFMARTVNLKI